MTKRYGMFIDLDRCIGCHTCTIACKEENGTPLGVSWLKVLTVGGGHLDTPRGTYPNLSMSWLPMLCMHCQVPPCEEGCPTAAISRRADGIVLIDYEKCNACLDCMNACPYGVLQYNRAAASGGGEENRVEKCTLCAHRIDRGQQPFCVEACSWQAMFFGDLADPDSEIAQAISRRGGRPLKPEQGTGPSVFYGGLREE